MNIYEISKQVGSVFLDYFNMLKISEVIKNFSKDKIVFIVTHDKELIDNICNKLLEISNGKINKFCERR